MPRFRLVTVLGVTAVFAIALLALVKPSFVWLFIWPPLACLAAVFAVIRAVTTPRERIFWVGMIVGATAYGSCVLFVELMSAVLGGPEPASSVAVFWVCRNTGCTQIHLGPAMAIDDGSITGESGVELCDARFMRGYLHRAVASDAVSATLAALRRASLHP